jgi:DNA-binding winged helix-turn-helix (wHTH) protein
LNLFFLFNDYTLDTARRELRRGSALMPVEPQVFDLLAFLISNRDRVVSKDDLLASVWGGRIVSESTIATRMNAARAAIADSGGAQRLIRTLPRKGFRFVGEVREAQALPSDEPASGLPAVPVTSESGGLTQRTGIVLRYSRLLPVLVLIAAVVGGLLVLATRSWDELALGRANTAEEFDPAIVPLLNAADRLTLADYSKQPQYKALAIAALGWGQAAGEADVETAKSLALQRCGARAQTPCFLYAVGMKVVQPKGIVPLPAPGDQRTELLSSEFTSAGLAIINASWQRAAQSCSALGNHRALAASERFRHWVGGSPSLDEAERLAVERCGYESQAPCLLLSADGYWTVEIPTSRRIVGIFMPGTDTNLPNDQRSRISSIFQGKPWRALARGQNGTWHAVAGAASEAAAVEAALQSCAAADTQCELLAIGNFRVANAK